MVGGLVIQREPLRGRIDRDVHTDAGTKLFRWRESRLTTNRRLGLAVVVRAWVF